MSEFFTYAQYFIVEYSVHVKAEFHQQNLALTNTYT